MTYTNHLRRFGAVFLSLALVCSFVPPSAVEAAGEFRSIVFPVIGTVSYYDDFGAPRSGHTHEGNDLMGKKMLPLVAVADGTISWVQYPQPDWGYAINIRDAEGFNYWYLHVNNDNPGTDDGQGGGFRAYAPDIFSGAPVVKGQLIGWMGDSGNAESTGAHLHFEIHDPSGAPYSPYASLKAAPRITTPVDGPKLANEILPYGNFKGGATVAAGNFGGNAALVTGAGPGGGPHVKVMSADGTLLSQFFPYPMAFRGGVNVAAGDINGDGISEIITGAGAGGGPHVRILSSTGIPLGQFFPYPAAFKGGVQVAAGDLDGDGKAEIVTGAGPGGGPQVRVFRADGTAIAGFFPYDKNFKGGVNVAIKPAAAGSPARIVTSPGPGGGPHVRTFDMMGNPDTEFFAYDAGFSGGVKVAVQASSLSGTYTIITAPASKGGPDIKLFSSSGQLVESRKAYEEWWRGGYSLFATPSTIYIIADGRRASLREIPAVSNGWGGNNQGSGNGSNGNGNGNGNGGWGNWGGGGRGWWGN